MIQRRRSGDARLHRRSGQTDPCSAGFMLGHRKPSEQNVILMIGESRDRSSKTDTSSVLLEAQRQNASIYWLTFSTFLAPFTNKQKTIGDS